MSNWNYPWTNGLHTFYINKRGTNYYDSYNWDYREVSVARNNLDAFNDGDGFIAGYIVW